MKIEFEEMVAAGRLNASVDIYKNEFGYRLDMICPADAPTVAILSKDDRAIRLVSAPSATAAGTDWVTGRAGMEYRDLIPGRADGRMIASHIRLTDGGEVPDYVHYHKVDFQMIFCLTGRIRVVYEDQGPPFWLEPGDCVLQPPEIRHRVLECTAGAEVIEIGMPAVHETWVEHDMALPTQAVAADRAFGGQRFVRHIAAVAAWKSEQPGIEAQETDIWAATNGLAGVQILKISGQTTVSLPIFADGAINLYYVMSGSVRLVGGESDVQNITAGSAIILTREPRKSVQSDGDANVLWVTIK